MKQRLVPRESEAAASRENSDLAAVNQPTKEQGQEAEELWKYTCRRRLNDSLADVETCITTAKRNLEHAQNQLVQRKFQVGMYTERRKKLQGILSAVNKPRNDTISKYLQDRVNAVCDQQQLTDPDPTTHEAIALTGARHPDRYQGGFRPREDSQRPPSPLEPKTVKALALKKPTAAQKAGKLKAPLTIGEQKVTQGRVTNSQKVTKGPHTTRGKRVSFATENPKLQSPNYAMEVSSSSSSDEDEIWKDLLLSHESFAGPSDPRRGFKKRKPEASTSPATNKKEAAEAPQAKDKDLNHGTSHSEELSPEHDATERNDSAKVYKGVVLKDLRVGKRVSDGDNTADEIGGTLAMRRISREFQLVDARTKAATENDHAKDQDRRVDGEKMDLHDGEGSGAELAADRDIADRNDSAQEGTVTGTYIEAVDRDGNSETVGDEQNVLNNTPITTDAAPTVVKGPGVHTDTNIPSAESATATAGVPANHRRGRPLRTIASFSNAELNTPNSSRLTPSQMAEPTSLGKRNRDSDVETPLIREPTEEEEKKLKVLARMAHARAAKKAKTVKRKSS